MSYAENPYQAPQYTFAAQAAENERADFIVKTYAHLAGAMAKPVWTLLPVNACWRYLWNCEKTPWYPTMRMFRQSTPGDWKTVVRIVEWELRKMVSERINILE